MPPAQHNERRYDIFLAHSSDDRDQLVVSLVEALRMAGTSVWYAEFEMEPSSKVPIPHDGLQRLLSTAMEECDFGCLVVSASFLDKRWPMMELNHWLSQRRRAKITIILHNVSITDVARKIQIDAESIAKRFDVVNAIDGISRIVSTITRKIPRRALIKFKYPMKKSGEVAVFTKLGLIGLARIGSFLSSGGSVPAEFFDFSGKPLDSGDEYQRIIGTILRQADVDNAKIGRPGNSYNFPVRIFPCEKDVTYVHMSHLHLNPITDGLGLGLEEIDLERCALNFGSNTSPLVFYPFYSCDSFTAFSAETVGIASPGIEKQLRLARGSWSGNWRRVIWRKDGQFLVVGDGD